MAHLTTTEGQDIIYGQRPAEYINGKGGNDILFASANDSFSVNIAELSGSGVTGTATITQKGSDIDVTINATGLEANAPHPQHIHGLIEGDSKTPTLADDADGDGFIELLEGLPQYGGIRVSLTSPEGGALEDFPTAPDGTIDFQQTYKFDVTNQEMFRDFANLIPLEDREIVLHGRSLEEGDGAGTMNEADGTAGYKAVLPVAAGEIVSDSDVATGADTIDGGKGNDVIFGSSAADVLNGNEGADSIAGGGDNDTITGGAGRDLLLGQAGDDVISGGEGKDTIEGGSGNDTLDGGFGIDQGIGRSDIILGGSGDDRIQLWVGGTARGGDDNDILLGASGVDRLFGDEGRDTLKGNGGDDYLDGGLGDDRLFGKAGEDIIVGNAGNDLIDAGLGDDTVAGNAGNDTIFGDAGDDVIAGGSGNDLIAGQQGADTITGGTGQDTFLFFAETDSLLTGDNAAFDVITDYRDNFDMFKIGSFINDFSDLDIYYDNNVDQTIVTTIDAASNFGFAINGNVEANLEATDFMFA